MMAAPDTVLAMAARGWRLFPCRSRDKTPLVREWQHVATTDPAQLRAWHAQHPSCNWGLACGPGSGVWVLDVDGDIGRASLRALIAQYSQLPATLSAQTSKGGHLYYRWPDSTHIHNSAGKLGAGLDVRGDGGYVVVPPSVHPSGRLYEWSNGTAPVADAPEWMLKLAESPAESSPPQVGTGERIPRGKGEPMKFDLAWKMFKAGCNEQEVLDAALARDKRCEHREGEAVIRRRVADWQKRFAGGDSPVAGPRRAEIVTLADVVPREVEWLWRPYLPAGMLAMLSGDPGAGKTFLALAVAAALTRGNMPYSRETCTPLDVLYLSVENDPACVVRPRFDAMGGDPTRLHLVRGSVIDDGNSAEHGAIWLTDVSVLAAALGKTHARLLIVDPIQSYLGAEVDAHRANETRPVLDGLARLAEEHGCCVLLLRHLTKAQTGRAIHRGLGSIDFTGAVRCEMLAGCSPDDRDQRALVQIKNNLGAYSPALGYVIDETGHFRWTGETTLTHSDILAPESTGRDSAQEEAVEWLRTYLADGPRTAKEVERAAKDAGIAWRTVRRAKQIADIISRKGAFGGGWEWVRASTTDPEDGQDVQT